MTYSDVDTGDTHSFSIDTAAAYGVASVDADGTWHYTVTDAGAVDALGQGDTLGDSFTVKVADNNGLFATQTVAITITGTNDAPTIANTGPAPNFTENGAPVAVAPALTVADIDSANLVGATVTISGGYQAGADSLDFTDQNGIHGVYADGVLTLTGTASVADYEAALRSITYSNSSDAPAGASRTITFQVDDGGSTHNLSDALDATVTVTAVNDAPVLTPVGPICPRRPPRRPAPRQRARASPTSSARASAMPMVPAPCRALPSPAPMAPAPGSTTCRTAPAGTMSARSATTRRCCCAQATS